MIRGVGLFHMIIIMPWNNTHAIMLYLYNIIEVGILHMNVPPTAD